MENNQFQTFEESNFHSQRRLLWALIFYVVTFFILSLIITIIVQLIYLGVYNNFKIIEENNPRYEDFTLFSASVANLLVYLSAVILLVFFLKSYLIEDWKKTKKEVFVTILIGVGGWMILLCSVLIANQLEALIRTWLQLPAKTPENQESIIKLFQSKYLPLILLVTLIGAPIVEELVFRKSIFGYFKYRFKLPPAVIIIISGFLFGMIHVVTPILDGILTGDTLPNILNELISVISYSFMGMGLGIVYYLGKENIYVSFVTHFTQNLISSIGQIILIFYPEILPK